MAGIIKNLEVKNLENGTDPYYQGKNKDADIENGHVKSGGGKGSG